MRKKQMKLFWIIILFTGCLTRLHAQEVQCKCRPNRFLPFNKTTLTFHQEINIDNLESNFIIYAPIISNDTIMLKLISDQFLWKFKDEQTPFLTLNESASFSDFNASFRIKLSNRRNFLFHEKITLELEPVYNFATTNAPMLHKIMLHSEKGINRMVFKNGNKKLTCFLPFLKFKNL
jgi:hypothetical protein